MADFYVALSTIEMANQIADMLNTHNKLTTRYTGQSLLCSAGRYFVEIERDKVIGCVAVQSEPPELTKLFHACVVPEKRKHGIAKKLMNIALAHCKTPYAYGTIREDNKASLAMVYSLGFVYAKKEWHRDHYVITVGRRAQAS
jgi:ribosomal protein S18 acetylase RimI-like enzyme